MRTTRRTVLGGALGGALAGSVGLGAGSAEAGTRPRQPFAHGVASGDPLPRSVVIWTRVTPTTAATPGSGRGPAVTVTWAVAEDPGFRRVVARGRTRTSAARDHTVHVDVKRLRPGTEYWYRFGLGRRTSRVGRTRTAPATRSNAPVRFGFASCANYDQGWFTPYRFLAAQRLDAVLHLGDYLYEYAPGPIFGSFPKGPRRSQPDAECTTLAQYRQRHACYRGDADLQAMHAAHPVIAIWDDHEVANDTWRDGAENHQGGEGTWAARSAAGRRAFLEWLPVRRNPRWHPFRIHRRFRFGRQVDLWMLDERRFRTKPPRSAFLGYGSLDPSTGAASASMLGDAQEAWLVRGLRRSTARWKVLGNQVPFFPQAIGGHVPGQIARLLGPRVADTLARPLAELYVEDWNGFRRQRQRLVDAMTGVDDVVVLTGDVHQSYASEIPRRPEDYLLDRRSVAVEFVTPGVASPSVQAIAEQVAPGAGRTVDAVLSTNNAVANPWIRWAEGLRTGCVVVDLDGERAQADWFLASSSQRRDAKMSRSASWQTRAGSSRLSRAPRPLPGIEL